MSDLEIVRIPGGFEARLRGRLVLAHRPGEPLLRAGRGEARFEMYRGNFEVSERLDELVALEDCGLEELPGGGACLLLSRKGLYATKVVLRLEEGRLVASFSAEGPEAARANRYRVTLPAEPSERVYGCGEQFSHFDLRGRVFPLWTSEQGVGRNKTTEVTRLADLHDRAGGDYWWTFFPEPTFATSRRLSYHLETSAYAAFDFRSPSRHELYAWALPGRLVIGAADTMRELVSGVSALLGRQPELPDWAYDGVVLGIQGGTEACLGKLERARKAGVPVAGIWAQDWEGINMTSFGQRLRWDWQWDRERYPGLPAEIARLRAEGVRFLGYVNPYVAAGKPLYAEASAQGLLARRADGSEYLVDFGEFDAGIVDFTNPAAVEWFKGVIKKNLVGIGLSGWMADFGEYLPTDAVLFDGTPAEIAHNAWPAVWARVNREAVDEAAAEAAAARTAAAPGAPPVAGARPPASGAAAASAASAGGAAAAPSAAPAFDPAECLYFMRAGFTGSQRDCPLMWAGDQNVDWSKDDGLPSVIPAALSLAVCGHGLHHSDIGGYTTLFGMRRTKELFLRWAEQAAFTPFMRSHEGNRPKDNWQFDSDEETLAGLGRMGRLHAALKPYLKACVGENAREGVPVMRPLFLHFEEDPLAWSLEDEYLLGPDLLAAPVLEEGAARRRLHLPPGAWIHLWSGSRLEAPAPGGASVEVEAPLGEPPAFYREGSLWTATFAAAAAAARAARGSAPGR